MVHEARILSSISSEFVLRYRGTFFNEKPPQAYVVMDYMEQGDLQGLMDKNKDGLAEGEAWQLLRSILHGLYDLHNGQIVHRDVKPQNILLDANGMTKLADFGLSKHFTSQTSAKGFKGTLVYGSPRSLEGQYAPCTDVWAVGVIAVGLFTGKLPYDDDVLQQNEVKFMNDLVSKKIRPRVPTSPMKVHDFVKSCFLDDPKVTTGWLLDEFFEDDIVHDKVKTFKSYHDFGNKIDCLKQESWAITIHLLQQQKGKAVTVDALQQVWPRGSRSNIGLSTASPPTWSR